MLPSYPLCNLSQIYKEILFHNVWISIATHSHFSQGLLQLAWITTSINHRFCSCKVDLNPERHTFCHDSYMQVSVYGGIVSNKMPCFSCRQVNPCLEGKIRDAYVHQHKIQSKVVSVSSILLQKTGPISRARKWCKQVCASPCCCHQKIKSCQRC